MREVAAASLYLAIMLPAGAAAQEVHQVTGIGASDVLNVRRAPSSSAPIVGALSPLADFVILRERRGAWARVELERGVSTPVRGWVAARYLELAYGEASPAEGIWACHGTEPFWNVWIEGGEVRYRDDIATVRGPLADLRPSGNEPGTSWTFTFNASEDRRVTGIMLAGTVCSDGMSETTTRRTLLLTGPQGGLVNGCCRRPLAEDSPPRDPE